MMVGPAVCVLSLSLFLSLYCLSNAYFQFLKRVFHVTTESHFIQHLKVGNN